MTTREAKLDDAQTNPIYSVRILPNGEVRPTQAAIDAANEAAKQQREKRNAS